MSAVTDETGDGRPGVDSLYDSASPGPSIGVLGRPHPAQPIGYVNTGTPPLSTASRPPDPGAGIATDDHGAPMTRLVALPGRIRGQANAGPVQWINPERIVTIRPKISETDTFDLTIELKLDGVPLFETWFGSYPTIDAADARWQAFLHELHPQPSPPETELAAHPTTTG